MTKTGTQQLLNRIYLKQLFSRVKIAAANNSVYSTQPAASAGSAASNNTASTNLTKVKPYSFKPTNLPKNYNAGMQPGSGQIQKPLQPLTSPLTPHIKPIPPIEIPELQEPAAVTPQTTVSPPPNTATTAPPPAANTQVINPQPPAAAVAQPAASPPAEVAPAAVNAQDAAAATNPAAAAASAIGEIDTTPYEAILNNPKATPQQQEAARADYAQKWTEANKANITDDLRASITAWQKDPNSPQAKLFNDRLGDVAAKFKQQQISAALAQQPDAANNPDKFGAIVAGADNMWDQVMSTVGPAGLIGLGLGVPLTMIGLLGGSGLSLILGSLGLGLAGASSGMFGESAQGAVNNMVSGMAEKFAPMFGINLPNEADIRARLTTAARSGPEQAQLELAKIKKEVEPYAKYNPTARKFMEDTASDDYMYNQALQYMVDNFDTVMKEESQKPSNFSWTDMNTWRGPLENAFDAATASSTTDQAAKIEAIKRIMARRGWAPKTAPVPQKKAEINKLLNPRAVALNIAQKAARCWSGYEPVPGAKAYTPGSCRPKGSKKTKKEVINSKRNNKKSK
jgi:hypothetical protein